MRFQHTIFDSNKHPFMSGVADTREIAENAARYHAARFPGSTYEVTEVAGEVTSAPSRTTVAGKLGILNKTLDSAL